MLKLVYGKSGSGKSTWISNQIKQDVEAQKHCFLLVPDQQTYITNETYLSILSPSSRMFFEVLGFSELISRVESICGGGAFNLPDKPVAKLILWNTLRKLHGCLNAYKGQPDQALTSLMFDVVTEIASSGISTQEIETYANTLPENATLKTKLNDICLISANYQADFEKVAGSHNIDRYHHLAELLENYAFFQNTNVYVDSFNSFSGTQLHVLELILKQSDKLTVTICADQLTSKQPQFEESTNTAARLTSIANKLGMSLEKEYLKTDTRGRLPFLQHIEANIWDYAASSLPETMEPDGSVELMTCENIYTEAEVTALKILELVNNGVKFGNIAITVSNTDAYDGIINTAFDKYHIPYFMAQKVTLASKPIARLLLGALKTIAGHFKKEDVINIGKTGLCAITPDEMDLFATYCSIWDINGTMFEMSQWTMNPNGLTDEIKERGKEILKNANHVREIILPPLFHLDGRIKGSLTVNDCCEALYLYLEELNIQTVLADIAKNELSVGHNREANDTLHTYDSIISIMATICEVLPNEKLSLNEFIAVFTLMLQQTEMGAVPSIYDCVTVGSSNMLRVEHVDAMFVLGVNEGEFPKVVTDSGVITESEKTDMFDHGLVLDSNMTLQLSHELFGIYQAFSKPSKKLIVSAQLQSPGGNSRLPSSAFTRVASLLPSVKIQNYKQTDLPTATESAPFSVDDAIMTNEKRGDPSHPLVLSQSKINDFQLCPYRYFANYEMKLFNPTDIKMNYRDSGILIHLILESAMQQLAQEKDKGATIDDAFIANKVDSIVLAELQKHFMSGTLNFERSNFLLHEFERLRTQALIMVRAVYYEQLQSDFKPVGYEVSFEPPREKMDNPKKDKKGQSVLSSICFPLADQTNVFMRGKVDRIDLCETDNNCYVRVVDYKSGSKTFKLEDVQNGEDIQLMLYLFTICDQANQEFYTEKSKTPAVVTYFSLDSKATDGIKRTGALVEEDAIMDAVSHTRESNYLMGIKYVKKDDCYKGPALRTTADFDLTNSKIREFVTQIGEQIHGGDIHKTPSKNSCKNCPLEGRCLSSYKN